MDNQDVYRTIKSPSEGYFKDRGSKFYAFAYPVSSENQISEIREKLRKKYYDARHHVYAYRLGADKKIYRASDDGEPANSSGTPVLGQIRSFDLTDILIVVVRYFGGTKLGIPGLINAYKTAAKDAINNAEVIEKTVGIEFTVKFPYESMNDVMRIVKEEKLEQTDRNFDVNCRLTLRCRLSAVERVTLRLSKIRNVEIVKN